MINIPIFLSADNNYAPFVATTIASICDNTKSFCDFYVLDGGITKENKEKICELKNKFNNFSLEFIYIDVNKCFENYKVNFHFSKSMYLKFLIPEIKGNIDKALYSDVDVIALGDIVQMYHEDLHGYLLGSVAKEFSFKNEYVKNLNLSVEHIYFESGNLIIDCEGFRRDNIIQKLFDIEKLYQKFFIYPDQDILNICFDANYQKINYRYCFETNYFDFSEIDPSNIVIRHFEGFFKPWQISESLETDLMPNKNDFWRYAKITPFYSELQSKTIYNVPKDLMKFNVYNLLKRKII